MINSRDMPPDRNPRINLTLAESILSKLDRYAESRGSKPATEAAYLLTRILDDLEARGQIPQNTSPLPAEDVQLLIDFLNYLIDHFDHDGFSLSEISKLLGRPDDKGLVRLVQKLQQNGQPQTKPGARTR